MGKAALKVLVVLGVAVTFAVAGDAAGQAAASSPQAKPAQSPNPLPGYPPPPPGPGSATVIPGGTIIHVILGTTLTDATNKVGDKFTGTVADPVEVNGKVLIPQYSEVDGHVSFVRPAGRIAGKGEMRIVLDKIVTTDNVVYPLTAPLGQGNAANCGQGKKGVGKAKTDEEGTVKGCGKSKKGAAKAAAIGAAFGAAGGATVGLATRGGCDYYYGCWPSQGPSFGADVAYGAGIGAGTVLIYELFKHEKHVILLEGTKLTFALNRATNAEASAATQAAAN